MWAQAYQPTTETRVANCRYVPCRYVPRLRQEHTGNMQSDESGHI
jgi:hypothetical protein